MNRYYRKQPETTSKKYGLLATKSIMRMVSKTEARIFVYHVIRVEEVLGQ